MTITITRDRAHKMKHTATVRQHAIALDEPASNGGEDLGVGPHDHLGGALGEKEELGLRAVAGPGSGVVRGHLF